MIAVIAARSGNNVIGKDGKIPWDIPGEKKQFRELTTGNTVIMGRKTFEECGILPGRDMIIVSKTKTFEGEHIRTVHSFQEALDAAGDDDVYVCGGYQLYLEALEIADCIYLTEIDLTVENGDVFFPEFDESSFDMEVLEEMKIPVKCIRKLYKRRVQTASEKR